MRRRDFLSAGVAALLTACSRGRVGPEPGPVVNEVVLPRMSGKVGIGIHEITRKSLDLAWAMGMWRVRTTVYLDEWRLNDFQYRFEEQMAATRGSSPLLVLHGWSGSDDEYIRICKEVAFWAPHASLQLWNEVDQGFPGSERFGRSPGKYALFLERAYGRIKAEHPEVPIVASGLMAEGVELARWVEAVEPFCDVVAVHAYGFPVRERMQRAHTIARGCTDKKIWCTEWGIEKAVLPPGWSTPWEETQLDQIKECIATDPFDRSYLHVLWDGRPESHAIMRPDWTPTATANWLLDGRAV